MVVNGFNEIYFPTSYCFNNNVSLSLLLYYLFAFKIIQYFFN